MYFFIEPEVGGGFGENSVIDTSVHPPRVSKLHYQFDGWLGDDLLETFPCYIVSELLAREIESAGLKGYVFGDVEISKSDQFNALYIEKELPTFYWLKITGVAGKDDFGISEDHRLTVSGRALEVLNKGNIENADVEGFNLLLQELQVVLAEKDIGFAFDLFYRDVGPCADSVTGGC